MMVPEGSKRSLNLSFDFVDKKQVIDGYRTLNLLNANGDPDVPARGRCTREIARAVHPGAEGELRARRDQRRELGRLRQRAAVQQGLHCATISRRTKGARWKVPGSPGGRGGLDYLGDDVAAYKRLYEIKSKDDPKSWADLINAVQGA